MTRKGPEVGVYICVRQHFLFILWTPTALVKSEGWIYDTIAQGQREVTVSFEAGKRGAGP